MLGMAAGGLLICIKPSRRGLRFHRGMHYPSTRRTPCDNPEQFRRDELSRALHHLQAGEDPVRVIERLAHRLTNKLLHPPTKKIGDSYRFPVTPAR